MLYELCALPTTEHTLCKYAAYRFKTTNNTAKSFKNELYGIKDAHTNNGHQLDVSMKGMPRLGKIRRGWMRERLDGFRKREPITSHILKKYLAILCDGSYDHQTLRSLLCLAKFGVLRVSEYSYGEGGYAPLVKHCSIIPDMDNAMYLVYRFNKSKTNQFGREERVVCICQCPEPCPVHELVKMLKMRKYIKADDKLFWLKDGSSPTASEVNNLIKNLSKLCGLDPSKFRSHQLRSGGVVDSLTAGVPDSIIQELTRWKNLNSMIPYKKLSDQNLADILNKHK